MTMVVEAEWCYATPENALDTNTLVRATDCLHAEHWADVPDDGSGWLWWDDAPAICRMAQRSAECFLLPEHQGEHCWCPFYCGLTVLGVRHTHSPLLPLPEPFV